MKEIMEEMFGLMCEYDMSEILEGYVGLDLEKMKKRFSDYPLRTVWNEPPTDEDEITQHKLIQLYEKLLSISDPQEEYSSEDSEANHYTYYPFKNKTTGEYYAFLNSWNSWGDGYPEAGVYKVTPRQVTVYNIVK